MGLPPASDSPLALGEVREAAARLGFSPVPGTSMAVLAARQGAGIAGAVLLPLIPSIHPFLSATVLSSVIATMVVNQRVGDSLRAVPTLLFSVVVAGCGAGLVRMLDMTPLTCLTIVPGAQPFVDLVGVVGVGLLSYGIVFSQAATLFDRIGNVSAAVVIISRSPALTGLCAAGNAFDDRVAHAAKTWAYVGGLVGTIVVGLVAGLGATLLFAPASSLDEASARLSRVAMRIAHALRMTVRALSRVQDASQPPSA